MGVACPLPAFGGSICLVREISMEPTRVCRDSNHISFSIFCQDLPYFRSLSVFLARSACGASPLALLSPTACHRVPPGGGPGSVLLGGVHIIAWDSFHVPGGSSLGGDLGWLWRAAPSMWGRQSVLILPQVAWAVHHGEPVNSLLAFAIVGGGSLAHSGFCTLPPG